MKAKIQFVRVDEDSSLPEPEVVFEVIPNTGDGVNTKNRWLCRVALSMVATSDTMEAGNNTTKEVVELAREQIKAVMGIE